MRREILISGTGGQGIVAAGEFLSEALVRNGYEVILTRSYGSEARGGSCRSEVLVSDKKIYDMQLTEPDALIILSLPAYRRHVGRAKVGALVVVDASVLDKAGKEVGEDVETVPVPAGDIAARLGNPIVANMVLLGALAKRSPVLSLERLKEAVNEMMRPSLRDVNLRALEAGYNSV